MSRTVRETVEAVAQQRMPLYQAVDDFEHRTDWAQRAATAEQRAGVHDFGPPDDNSFDWVDLTTDLTEVQRWHLRLAHDRSRARR